jgi:hypothetical protein
MMKDYNKRIIDMTAEELRQLFDDSITEKIIQLQQQLVSQEKEDIVGIDEAMRITGYARQTLYGKCSSGEMHGCLLGKNNPKDKSYFSRTALINWLSKRGEK